MTDLTGLALLVAKTPSGPAWAVAFENHILYAWRVQNPTRPQSVSAPMPPPDAWQQVAVGQQAHDLLVKFGIFDRLVARLGENLANRCKPRKVGKCWWLQPPWAQ